MSAMLSCPDIPILLNIVRKLPFVQPVNQRHETMTGMGCLYVSNVVDCGHLPFAISTGDEQARRSILMSDGVSRGWRLCYYFAAVAIFGTFLAFGEPDRGVVGGFSFAVIVLAAKIRWDLRTELWYQALFALLTTAHVVALFAVDWMLHLKPTILYAPLATAEFVLIVYLVFFLEKRLGTKQNER